MLIIIGAIIVLIIAVQIVNTDRYKTVVNVVEGENIMGINPLTDNLDFGDLSRNTGATRYISIENNGNYKIYIMVWKFGNITELIEISRNNFTLEPGDKERLEFQLMIPVSASDQRYEGSVWIFKIPQIW